MDEWKDWQINWHLLTQGLDQKVDTIASHTVREGILETHTRLMLGIDVYPRPHLSASTRLRLRNKKNANMQKNSKIAPPPIFTVCSHLK